MPGLSQTILFKIVASLVVIFITILIAALIYIPQQIERFAIQDATKTATNMVAQYKTLRGYYTKNVVKKVLEGSDIKPTFNHANDPKAIPLPATLIHELSELTDTSDIRLNLYSKFPFPNRADRRLDEFQAGAWEQFLKDPKKEVMTVTQNGSAHFVKVAIADTMSAEACVSCHNSHPQSPKTNWKLGDVRGVLEVTIPVTGILAQGQSLANTLVFLLALIFVLVIAGIYGMFKHSVNRPLTQIAARLGQISDGGSNMFEPIAYQKNDELKPIVKQFNRFVLHLKSTLSNINQQSDNLSSSTDHLDKAIVNAVSLINSQHSETDQTAAAIEEMSNTLNMVAENAETGFEQAQTTETLANEGIRVMKENQTAIRSLADEIERASEVIGRLDQDSDEIGSVVNVIRGIADQTNLLALNAAIEAARAGEQGRGFAVVADEVRTLASRTQDSTKEIKTMIERIQSGTREAVQVMQSGRAQLENSVHRTEDAAQTLDRIKKAVADIRSVNQSSSQASGEQRQAAEQINRSIHAISNLAEQNADSAKAVSEGIATLRQIVNGLNGAIARFDL